MLQNNEKNLLNFIKYSPILFIAVIAILVNILIHVQNEINLEKQIQQSQQDFINTQKLIVTNEVNEVYKNIISEKLELEEKLRKSIKLRVYEAYSIVTNIYDKYKYLGDKEVLELVKTALRDIRFNEGRGYYFIDDITGTKQLQPFNPSMEGKSFLNFSDSKGYQFVRTIVETIKSDTERFDEYYWYKTNIKDKSFRKISFYKTFKPLNIAIGTGEYVDDATENLKRHLLQAHIQNASFGKNGYVFVVDKEGTYLSHVKKSYIGLNRIGLTDKNGFEITKEVIKVGEEGEGFIRYVGTIMPQTGLPSMKTTYVKGFKEWGWAIGAGFYDQEINVVLNEKKKQLELINTEYRKKILFISIIITIILLLVSLSISQVLKKYFMRYNSRILNQVKENKEKEDILYQQSKMAAMGEMLANIAHQWRQPLSVITTVATSMQLQKELDVLEEKDEQDGLRFIVKNAEYLSHTIDDFKDFFKPDKEKVIVSVESIFDKTLLLLSSKLKDKEIEVISNIQHVEVSVLENEFIQVLINIINNSEDALSKRKMNKLIFIDVVETQNSTLIKIKDNAGGINSEIIQRIFEPYFTTKHQAQGTGIGLYMVKQIVNRHMNGDITASNVSFDYLDNSYKGAEFVIELKHTL